MPDISETPVTVTEFMNPVGETTTNNLTPEGQYSYSNYYTMLSNMANIPMTAAMNSYYNPTSPNMPNVNSGEESKSQENLSLNEKGK